MKLGILFTVLVTIVLVQAPANSSVLQTGSDDKAKLTHLKKVLWKKAYREQDTALLESILAEEFQVIFDGGEWSDKKGELEYIKKNRPDYDSFEYEIRRLDIFANGTAIIAGEGHVIGKNANGEYEYKYQSSNVLIKRNGNWKAISSHVSGVKHLKGERRR
ncbi:MAG: nuclear transport factor 2 family protein [Pyrinomonadaceae bacterium]|nr:nuclear transport factor 2 family protein [Pyrinomonadaceae bacterium]